MDFTVTDISAVPSPAAMPTFVTSAPIAFETKLLTRTFVDAKKDTKVTGKLASPSIRYPLVGTSTIAILAPTASLTLRPTATPADVSPASGEMASDPACRFKLRAEMIRRSATNLLNASPSTIDSSANADGDIPATAMFVKRPTVRHRPTLCPFLPVSSSTPTE